MIDRLIEALIYLPIILFSLSLHEVSHGFMAYKLGDNTAKAFGRLTLNPLAHIDILGTLSMLLFRFGWAKPVPVNFSNLKYKRLGPILVSVAGPLSNFLLALITMIIYSVLLALKVSVHEFLVDYMIMTIQINVILAAFNLIPVPPLDGSKIVLSLLPYRWQFAVYKYEPYIQMGLFVLLYSGVLDPVINAIAGFALDIILKVGNFVFDLLS